MRRFGNRIVVSSRRRRWKSVLRVLWCRQHLTSLPFHLLLSSVSVSPYHQVRTSLYYLKSFSTRKVPDTALTLACTESDISLTCTCISPITTVFLVYVGPLLLRSKSFVFALYLLTICNPVDSTVLQHAWQQELELIFSFFNAYQEKYKSRSKLSLRTKTSQFADNISITNKSAILGGEWVLNWASWENQSLMRQNLVIYMS